MPRRQHPIEVAHACRHFLLLAWILCILGWGASMITPMFLGATWQTFSVDAALGVSVHHRIAYPIVIFLHLALTIALPLVYLQPTRDNWTHWLAEEGPPPRRAILVFALIGAMLCAAFINLLSDAGHLFYPGVIPRGRTVTYVTFLLACPLCFLFTRRIWPTKGARFGQYYRMTARFMMLGLLLWLIGVWIIRMGWTIPRTDTRGLAIGCDAAEFFCVTIALVGIGASTLLLFALLQVHRRRNGLCTACGYDLRANTTNACPECGVLTPLPSAERPGEG